MKDNIILLKDKNSKKKEYRILFNIQSIKDNKNYVIYTSDNKNKDNEIKTYVATYEISEKGNMTKFKELDEVPMFIKKIMDSLN